MKKTIFALLVTVGIIHTSLASSPIKPEHITSMLEIFQSKQKEEEGLSVFMDKLVSIEPSFAEYVYSESKIPGYYESTISGERVYISEDANHMFIGSAGLIRKSGDSLSFKTTDGKDEFRKKIIESTNKKNIVTYPAKNEMYELYTYTDVSCPFCKRMHKDIGRLNDYGVTVHYLMYPRMVEANLVTKMENITCVSDMNKRREMYDSLISQKSVDIIKDDIEPICDNTTVVYNRMMADLAGLVGTPFIMTKDGEVLGGYLTPEEIMIKLRR